MSGIRGVDLPLEHVLAEMAAFPLASVAASECGVVGFGPRLAERGHPTSTGRLWRAAERALVASFPSFSIDELAVLRDWLWFRRRPTTGGQAEDIDLVSYLRGLAHETLEPAGNAFRPQVPPWTHGQAGSRSGSAEARARHFWRWISFALPPDLLMAAHPVAGPQAAEVELVSPILARVLKDGGFVEPHLHLAAAVDFPLLWISAMHALADPRRMKAEAFGSPGAEGAEGAELGQWMLRAAISRYFLASFLRWRSEGLYEGSLEGFFRRLGPTPDHGEGAPAASAAAHWDLLTSWDLGALRATLREIASSQLEGLVSFETLQQLYASLTRIRSRWLSFPASREAASCADPIQSLFPAKEGGQRSSEMEWTAASLAYLSGAGRADRNYASLFWQTVRIRCRFYRHVVQRPMTPGLQWFVRFFRRMKPARGPMSIGLLVGSAARLCGPGHGLRSLELRTSPEPSFPAMRELIVKFQDAVRALDGGPEVTRSPGPGARGGGSLSNVEVGLVFHLSRDRGGGASQGLPAPHGQGGHADPLAGENHGCRYSAFYRARRAEAQALAELIARFPRVLLIIRGIDLCTDELGVPTWVMAPLCRHLAAVGRAASAHLLTAWAEDVPPLRTTVHAGEDFVHLLGGLRRIDEAIEQIHLGQGDRIGHGMALGVNAEEWARRSGGVAITRMERLFDLAWEWSFSGDRATSLPAARLRDVTEQIELLSKEIFGNTAHPAQVVQFTEQLFDEGTLTALCFPNGPVPSAEDWRNGPETEEGTRCPRSGIRSGSGLYVLDSWEMLYQYLFDQDSFRRGQEPILIDPLAEVEAISRLQTELRRKVGQAGITVEINPSSNLLIGDLGDLVNHPLWRLKPPRGGDHAIPIAVCIGSDNPLTFTTRTREEYQLIYDTLSLAGLTDAEAKRWVVEARDAGMDGRFTLPVPRDWSPEHIWTPMELDLDGTRPLL